MTIKGRPRADEADVARGAKIRALRLERGITQEQLGDRLGVSFQQVQKYEKGANRISATRLEQIAAALDVTPSYFLAGETPDLPPGDPLQQLLATRDGVRVAEAFIGLPPGAQASFARTLESLVALNTAIKEAGLA